jgi:glycerate 2-kinase
VRILVAPDSFKGTLSAKDAARAMANGIKRVDKNATVICAPMADGGEGTVDAWHSANSGARMVSMGVSDPHGISTQGSYLLLPDQTAVLELAQASGIMRLTSADFNNTRALSASTFGTGEILIHALEQGVQRVILALGGSATTEGGFGLLQAIGAVYYDHDGQIVSGQDATNLSRVARIDARGVHKQFFNVEFTLATDVHNVLCGSQGAAAIFGPQKGLSATGITVRDAELARFASLVKEAFEVVRPIERLEGCGAAGGAGLPFLVLPSTKVISGARLVGEAIGLPSLVEEADWVMTGEGCTDAQTLQGKVPAYVASLASLQDKPCAVVSGKLGKGCEGLFQAGVTHMISATPEGVSAPEFAEPALEFLQLAAYNMAQDLMS